ncbi:4-hydroxy-3-methylbut-2-enyl diphosphate reductase [Candidatus Desantisbacteria bacterium CG07_land_8_20_14_0_80_39_15]|uniref:4-hydroxy-3-methylbut-2-enyl diphosphate reductase n=1 Tax=Candidatus Desantisbacteria bacterium CG07_land_8_20_14_0_80_39_15 TaxID=1974549 RepID=A0A2M6ZGM9_9BACT|nr:MAG: 4-hydroxy-3-methylbut-2-enyl diphosphate reductase [Candidatus Desantisbacteria bacterium CG07_land_8_20_14_0_80_39_15]
MRIKLAKNVGFCFGVKRAMGLTLKALRENPGKPIYTFGPLIHNPRAIKKLKDIGVRVIHSLQNIKTGILIIPSHGLAPSIIVQARKKKLFIIDATCPYVLRSQRLAELLAKQGYRVIIVGKSSHPEIRGIIGGIKRMGKVIGKTEDLKSLPKFKKIGVITQTTESLSNFKSVIESILDKGFELKVYNTLCAHTLKRQEEARRIAKSVDLMLVIGGRNSANTSRLFEICRACVTTYQIESPDELSPDWLRGKKSIGLVSGTSTPLSAVKEVVRTCNFVAEPCCS